MDTRRSFLQSLGQLLLVTLLGVPLITPLLHWTAVPCTHDGHLHVHRIAAMRYAWENGIYFSRWVPDLAFGYGYPFFVFREPGPLYAILGPHLLGLPMAAASNLFYALAILAAGWFMFLWVRDIAGARAGFVSAVAYMAAPYILIDALVRGNAPESLALPLFPFLLWIGRRWLVKGSWVTLLFGILGLALLSLSHNISTLIFAPTLLVYLLAVGLLNEINWKSLLLRLALLFGLGLGLTFFYTGGALLEMDQVTLSQSTVTRNNDFHFNFATLNEMLAPVTADDANLVNPPLPIRLGWIPLALALIGATTLLWKRWMSKEQRGHVLVMIIGAAIFLFMALPVSLPLWEGIPLIDFVQFPWRFIGRAALPIAFLAGIPFMAPAAREKDSRRLYANLAALAAIALLILEAVPALYPRSCEEDAFPTIVDVHEYEAATGLVGVDPEGSYFPRTVEKRPQDSPLEIDYQEGRTPQRFDLSTLPEEATAEVEYEGFGATIRVNSPEAFTARYFSFFYPGWRATVDGEPLPIVPSDPEGLITFPVAEGEHTVTVKWGSTPLRSALSAVSLLALVAAGVIVFYIRSRGRQEEEQPSFALNDRSLVIGLAAVALVLLAFKLLLVDRELTPLHRPGAPVVDKPALLNAAELQFTGHNLSQDQVAAGDTFDVDLAWRTVTPTLETYQSNVWLAGPDGLLWSDKETYRPRLYEDGPETWEREAGQWSWDSREVEVLSGTPPGIYNVVMTLFDRNSLQTVTLVDESGATVGPTTVIDQIEVITPDRAPTFKPQYPLEAPLADAGLTLLGFNQDRSEAAPGDEVLLTLFWERTSGPLADSITVQLVDEADRAVYAWTMPIIRDGFDASTWDSGERLRAQHLLRLPAALESGEYQLQLQEQIPLAALSVTAPDRLFTAPRSETAVDIPFGDEALLNGYSVDREGDQLIVTLVWQAMQEIDTPYNVFVHLVDEQEKIVAQSDSGPAGWTRPTTGWVPGEYILDSHTLFLPASSELSRLRLRVGLYDPASGRRVTITAGDSAELSLND
ncbi:MAG: hypothetical protein ACK2UT_06515 [Candidatus Promineifilaceae bacterium]